MKTGNRISDRFLTGQEGRARTCSARKPITGPVSVFKLCIPVLKSLSRESCQDFGVKNKRPVRQPVFCKQISDPRRFNPFPTYWSLKINLQPLSCVQKLVQGIENQSVHAIIDSISTEALESGVLSPKALESTLPRLISNTY